MREFYKVVDYLKTTLEADISVHTITHGLRSMMDIDKKNIFPLVHLQVTSSTVSNSMATFIFEIAVVNLRNISKQQVTDKFLGNDNELDNLNTCHAILNRLVSILQNQNNTDAIQLVNIPTLQPIIFEESNLLDGWRCDLELIIPNNEIVVC